jgi:hypothetical protein
MIKYHTLSKDKLMMEIQDYWLRIPALNLDDDIKRSFDNILNLTINSENNLVIQYSLSIPKWQFLCYLADNYSYALHGSNNKNIKLFEPRQSIDVNTFGNKKAVYAAADGIWPIFYAICNREQYKMTINNACIYITENNNNKIGPLYFFSISKNILAYKPWQTGAVYILPKETFDVQDSIITELYKIDIPQLRSEKSVKPLAKLMVNAEDFPFLNNIRGHDDRHFKEYAMAMQTGKPLPEE